MRHIRVHLVADPMLTEALTERMWREPDLVVTGRNDVADAELVDAVTRARPDLVVLDATTRNWATTARRIVSAASPARLVVIAAAGDAADAVQASRARAAAWFPHGCSADRLVDALRTAAHGYAHYPADHLGAVLDAMWEDTEITREPGGAVALLTARERSVLECLVDGWRSEDISDHLDITVNTVRAHTSRILRKLGVHSRLEAVQVARAEGLLPDR